MSQTFIIRIIKGRRRSTVEGSLKELSRYFRIGSVNTIDELIDVLNRQTSIGYSIQYEKAVRPSALVNSHTLVAPILKQRDEEARKKDRQEAYAQLTKERIGRINHVLSADTAQIVRIKTLGPIKGLEVVMDIDFTSTWDRKEVAEFLANDHTLVLRCGHFFVDDEDDVYLNHGFTTMNTEDSWCMDSNTFFQKYLTST